MSMQRIEKKISARGSKFIGTAVILMMAVLAFLPVLHFGQAGQIGAGSEDILPIGATSVRDEILDSVYVSGMPIGISIGANGLIVQGQSAVRTTSGDVFPAADSGIQKGDVITKIDGSPIRSLYLLKRAIEERNGKVVLTVSRQGRTFEASVTPEEDISGQKRLGLTLKEDIGGVGTLTFVTRDGAFGALGHYIQDGDTGLREELCCGNIYPTSVDGVIKGEIGKAGGLRAEVNRLLRPIGTITENSLIGIYGDYSAEISGELVRVAAKGEAKMGAAQVLTTIDGNEPQLYDINIVKVISQSEADEKGMVIAVRDKRLLEVTGGIVQGMSGSPILQNGLFIGAVTHVFVQDPTRGYAVHSRFMVEQAAKAEYFEEAA